MTDYPGIVDELDTVANDHVTTSEALATFAVAYALLDVADAIRSTKETK